MWSQRLDPGYLAYALGKLEIEKLRDEFKRTTGDQFTLRNFHDRQLGIGMAPLWVHHELMMGEDPEVETPESLSLSENS